MSENNKKLNQLEERVINLTSEDINSLKDLSQEAFKNKTRYESLWKDSMMYCGLFNDYNQQNQNDRETPGENEINDSQPSVSLNKSTKGILSILLGSFPFFTLKLKTKIEKTVDKINSPFSITDIKDIIAELSKEINEEIMEKNTNFPSKMESLIKHYLVTGNCAIGVYKNKPNTTKYNISKLFFTIYTVNDVAWSLGYDNEPESFFMKYKWTADFIVKTICYDEGMLNNSAFENLPENIKREYSNSSTKNMEHDIQFILIPNKYKNPEATEGILSTNYIGYYVEFSSNKVLKQTFYYENPIITIRSNTDTNESYGKSEITNCIGDIRMLNKITGDAVESIQNSVNPYLGVLANALDKTSRDKIELKRDEPIILNETQTPSKGNPIFPILPQTDISATLQFVIPEKRQLIQETFMTDVIIDYMNKNQITATEITLRNNIRNKTLFYMILKFKNLLDNVIFISYQIIKKEHPQAAIFQFLDSISSNWFEIEYNTEITEIMRTSDISNIMNYINSIKTIANGLPPEIQQQIIKRIDFNKINTSLDNLFNKSTMLFTEEEFEQMQQAEAQAMAQQQEMQMLTQQAELNKINSEAYRNQKAIPQSKEEAAW
ncbi:MAG: head-tail connector protein [Rickettsiales bacterium]|jgi:hypothetical protein|nr:head-tail connector protein [Rickettsiales bacterium]